MSFISVSLIEILQQLLAYHAYRRLPEVAPVGLQVTFKSFNFVILLSENIFFAKLSVDNPIIFLGIEVCTEGA
jgi:hypothetical protein